MIKKITITLEFPLGANFTRSLRTGIYVLFINFVKNISCINIDSKCINCTSSKQCRYFKLTGENFYQYPGILIKKDVFEKTKLNKNEEQKIEMFFVGNNMIYSDYINIFFEQFLNQKIFNQFFYLKNIEEQILESKEQSFSNLKLKSIIENSNFKSTYNNMIQYYNQEYECKYPFIEAEAKLVKFTQIQWEDFHVKTKHLKVKGIIGSLKLENYLNIPMDLIQIGIGKYNFIGGGMFEIENNNA